MKNPFVAIKNLFTSKNEYSSNSSADVRTLFGTTTNITSSNAQQIANVFACVNIKANALAVMPIKLYKYSKNGKEEHKSVMLYNVLRYEPNNKLISSLYKKMISQDLDLRGNHYSQIVRNGLNEVVALYPLIADKMVVKFNKDGKRVYQYDGKLIKSARILHIIDIPDAIGLKGLSRIEYAKETLEFAKNTSRYGNNVFKNSATPSGSFEMTDTLDDEAYQRLKKDITEKYTDLEKAGTPLLLEGGLKFNPLSIKNSDAE